MYKPRKDQIALIRSIRICGTPYLGSTEYTCKSCGESHRVHLHCGNSHCMLCQHYKRLKWQSKLSSRLYNVPYVHTTFTLPRELRGLAKRNPKEVYNILFQSAWNCIQKIGEKIGAQLGMASVLHTWGSDLKYHPHIHCLITFGGIDKNTDWVWPESTKRLYRYRKLNEYYKSAFLLLLSKSYSENKIVYHKSYDELLLEIETKEWVVNNAWPTRNTEVIEAYLSKYINRSAVSKNRLRYTASNSEVEIVHKDYRKSKQGEPAVYTSKKVSPLVAIHKIIQHKLPVGFHRVRYYGLHHSAVEKKVKLKIDQSLLSQKNSVRLLFELLSKMYKLQNKKAKRECANCGGIDFDRQKIAGDTSWIYSSIADNSLNKSPPENIDMLRQKNKQV